MSEDAASTTASSRKIAVVGSRNFPNEAMAKTLLRSLIRHTDLVVSRGEKGPDTWGEEIAREVGARTKIHLPDWETHGKKAGMFRNEKIVQDADVVIAFWDGESKGTANTIAWALKYERMLLIVWPNGDSFREDEF